MENKRFASLPTVGASSLITIFAVLCLTVFALLSISTVLSEQRLGDAAEAAVINYYEADCRAEEVLAQLRSGEIPEAVKRDGEFYTYSCPLSETQALEVQVRVTEKGYEILRWQVVSTTDWRSDDGLPVWAG